MQYRKPLFIVLILFFGIIVIPFMPSEISAQEEELHHFLFPSRAVLQAHTFDSSPILVQFDRQEPQKLAFDIPVPGEKWQRGPLEQPEESNENIVAVFIHPDGPDYGMIQVLEYNPSHEVNPKDWLLWSLEQSDMKIITSAGEGEDGPGPFFEALAVSTLPEGSSLEPLMMRAGVFRNGNSFIVVRCMASSESYLNLAFYFGLTIHLFEIKGKQSPELIGQWDRYCIGPDFGTYCFTGPVPGPTSVESKYEVMEEIFYPLGLGNQSTGFINIRAISSPLAEKTPAETRINNVLYNMIEQDGLSFDENLLAFKSEHQNLGGTAYYSQLEGVGADNTAVNFFALSWEDDGEAILIFMLTDAREKNPLAWMINKRIFEIIAQSLSRSVKVQQ